MARRPPLAAGRAGGAGGAGGGAGLLTTSSKYADGAHPDADLSKRLASHQPAILLDIVPMHHQVPGIRTIALLLGHQYYLVLLYAKFAC